MRLARERASWLTVWPKTASGRVFAVAGTADCAAAAGLISLLVVDGKATSILQQNGINVGLLGADLSRI